jgi:serine/threonine protein kinase
MDQLRHLIYHPPLKPHPWDPFRYRPETLGQVSATPSSDVSRSTTPLSNASSASPTQRFLEVEIKHSPERGHPNICKLLDFFEDKEFYYLVMPRYGTGEDLFDRVESQPAGLDAFEVRSLLGQLTDSVRFLHANGIVHRDIKDENVILDGDGRCQLIDFGSAAHWRPGKRWDTFSGTLHYASPEIMRGEMYTGKEQDIWALGVVAYVLLVGETPFAELPDEVLEGLWLGSRALEALEARCGENYDEGCEADGGGALGDAGDFVRRCLEQDLADRPPAEQLLVHKFLVGNGGWVGKRGWKKDKEKV